MHEDAFIVRELTARLFDLRNDDQLSERVDGILSGIELRLSIR